MRSALSDEEFWELVFGANTGVVYISLNPLDYYDPESNFPDDPELSTQLSNPCTECGEFVCGYDWQGRPMYHRQTEEDS